VYSPVLGEGKQLQRRPSVTLLQFVDYSSSGRTYINNFRPPRYAACNCNINVGTAVCQYLLVLSSWHCRLGIGVG
jgi:hypothetical protein